MNELSLYTGAGGGVLASKLLGWRTKGYVEYSEYPQRIIAQRIKDGIFDPAPIFSDIGAFIDQGYADAYKGMVDVITAGFPCQPFSLAGRRQAADDERNKWPETMETIRRVSPAFCFLENVRGLLSAHMDNGTDGSVYYYGEILRDLSEGGYDARWCTLSAADVGANHIRERIWIVAVKRDVANADNSGLGSIQHDGRGEVQHQDEQEKPEVRSRETGSRISDTEHSRCEVLIPSHTREAAGTEGIGPTIHTGTPCDDVSDSNSRRCRQRDTSEEPGHEGQHTRCTFKVGRVTRWDAEPGIRGVANGVAYRSHRLTATGNGMVPAVAAAAWNVLTEDIL